MSSSCAPSCNGKQRPIPRRKRGLFGSKGFKPSRVILLVLASLSAAVAVALMVVGSPSEPAPVPEPVAQPVVATVAPVPMTRILVAAEAIGAGQKLTPTSVTWLEMADADILPGLSRAAASTRNKFLPT